MLDRRVLSKAYFTKEKIAQHHIESFNEFLERGLQKIIDEQKIVETDIPDTYVELGKIYVGNPTVVEADGLEAPIYPNEARLRNLTYKSFLYLEMAIIQNGEEIDRKVANIGQLPIMVKSKKCNLYGLSDDELIEKGEDPTDPGGYFIINGSERVLMTLEDLAPNKIFVEYEERYGDKIEVAKVFSQRRGYRALVVVERNKNSILEVSFPSVNSINYVTLVRALGFEYDQDIVESRQRSIEGRGLSMCSTNISCRISEIRKKIELQRRISSEEWRKPASSSLSEGEARTTRITMRTRDSNLLETSWKTSSELPSRGLQEI